MKKAEREVNVIDLLPSRSKDLPWTANEDKLLRELADKTV